MKEYESPSGVFRISKEDPMESSLSWEPQQPSQCLHCWQPLQASYFLWSAKRDRKIGLLRTPITPGWHRIIASKGTACQHEETPSDLSSCHWSSPQVMAREMKSAPQVPSVRNWWREEKILWNLKDLNSNVLAEASFYLSNAFWSPIKQSTERDGMALNNLCTR